ncbi:MAG: 23S rRNA (pseudouridine(1915)-N(3))-methyltransferase RlmH [Bacteroidetes bacterium]|nr:23S rRNA (pseudouridine(1915)-N(3))-methyltransferase RlmH [Bacteroidota bacterium]
MNKGYNRLLFITGGAYGVSDEIKKKADITIAASKFTFTHQMIRLIMMEQVYRAMTILKNESYHHD